METATIKMQCKYCKNEDMLKIAFSKEFNDDKNRSVRHHYCLECENQWIEDNRGNLVVSSNKREQSNPIKHIKGE